MGRDYNFLGTMNPLKIDIGYSSDENNKKYFLLEGYINIPFNAFGFNWNVKSDNLFWYRFNSNEPYYYKNTTGLSMDLPFRSTTFTFGIDESFIYNEEIDDGKKEIFNTEFQKGLYLSSEPFILWKIPTGFFVHRYGELNYTPGVSTVFKNALTNQSLLPFNRGPFLKFFHTLGFERINWHSNFRDGLSVSFYNIFIYDIYRRNNGNSPLSSFIAFKGAGYFILSDFSSITAQIQYRHWFLHDPDYYNEAGDMLRGIFDKKIKATHMLSLNLDFPFRVFVYTPSKRFANDKMKFFDFELQISPVIDFAIYNDPKEGISFHPKNTAFSGGIEFFIFPMFFRNLYLRLGFAWNLKELFKTGKLPSDKNREIYLLMRHFY